MPPKKRHAQRSGENARGAARLNMLCDEVPNTASPEYALRYPDGVETSSLLSERDRLGASPLTVASLAAEAKRPMSERAGAGMSGGKSGRTRLRRAQAAHGAVLREEADLRRCMEVVAQLEEILRDRETHLKPEAERLGYDYLYLYDKYTTVYMYFLHRAERMSAVAASERACLHALVSARSVRRWASDYCRTTTKAIAGESTRPRCPSARPAHRLTTSAPPHR